MSNKENRFDMLYQQAQILISKGYRPIPCYDKAPIGKNWNNRTAKEEISLWDKDWIKTRTNNIGIRTTNVTIIDIEKNGLEFFNRLQDEYGAVQAPKQYTARGGLHYYFTKSDITPGVKCMKLDDISIDIDVLSGDNKQALIDPSSFNGNKYRLEDDLPDINDLPIIPIWFKKVWEYGILVSDPLGLIGFGLKPILNTIIHYDQDKHRQAHIRDLFHIIPISAWDNRDTWIKAVYLVKYEFEELEALQILNDYCGKSDKSQEDDQENMYYEIQLGGNQVGIQWLMNLAGIHNPQGLTKLKKTWRKKEIWESIYEDVDVSCLWASLEPRKITQASLEEDVLESLEYEENVKPNVPDIMNVNIKTCFSDINKIKRNVLTREILENHAKTTIAHVIDNGKSYWLSRDIVDGQIEFKRIDGLKDIKNNNICGVINPSEPLSKSNKISFYDVVKELDENGAITYDKGVFIPSSNLDSYTPGEINTFTGFKAQLMPSIEIDLTERIRKHVLEVISDNNKVFYDYLMGWMAHIIQHPDVKTTVVPVICGAQGAGKSSFFEFFANEVIGSVYSDIVNINILTSQFNAVLDKKIFLFFDEVPMGFGCNNVAGTAINAFVTGCKLPIHKKGVDLSVEKSYHNIAMVSNSEVLVKWGRRFFGTVVNPKYANDENYHSLLRKDMANPKVARSFYQYLLNWNKPWSPKNLPETEYSVEQKIKSLSWERRFIVSLLEPQNYNNWEKGQKCNAHTWVYKQKLTSETLFAKYKVWINDNGYSKTYTTLREFIKDVEPLVGKTSSSGNIRVHVVTWELLRSRLMDLLKITSLPYPSSPLIESDIVEVPEIIDEQQ